MIRTITFICLLFLSTLSVRAADHLVIIVHGTWAANESWGKPGGNFFHAVERSLARTSKKLVSFTWAGNNTHECREQAALALVNLITSYASSATIDIITHSHGGNVGIIASQLLERHTHRIHHFYALGVPANSTHYAPNMNSIKHFYNLFSLEDYVQPVMGIFSRTYPSHDRITNVRIMLEGKGPSHSEMHHPTVGTWLLSLPSIVVRGKPCLVHFYEHAAPQYEYDEHQQTLLERNYAFQEKISLTLSWLGLRSPGIADPA